MAKDNTKKEQRKQERAKKRRAKKNRAEKLFWCVDAFLTPLQNLRRYKGISSVRNIQYDTSDDRLQLDVYYKEDSDDSPKPVIVYFAGGGFIGGSKDFRKSTLKFFASLGYVSIGIDHRLSPKTVFPNQIVDCYKGVNFLPEIADRFHLDLDRLIIGGDSSGGYFAMYTVAALLKQDVRDAIGLPEPKVKPIGCLGWCGAYEVRKLFAAKVAFDIARITGESFLGVKLDKYCNKLKTMDKAGYLSPLYFIDENWVPTFFNYSKKDLFCKGQGEMLEERLQQYGVPYRCSFVKNFLENHDYQLFAFNPHSKSALNDTAEYLRIMAEKGKLD